MSVKCPFPYLMTVFLLMGSVLIACSQNEEEELAMSDEPHLFEMRNLVAWCIIPYDNQNRTPQQRAEMLTDLGFSRMAYDWRDEHLPHFPEEIRTLQSHDIDLTAAWLWIDQRATDGLLPEHDKIFDAIEEADVSTNIWVGMHENFYEGLNEQQKVEKVAGMIREVRHRALVSGSSISLYNHGGWMGEPENQVRIIEATGYDDIGIVFNFHHGHDQIDRFEDALNIMMPYLVAVNLNGMEKGGAHILDIGQGDYETDMIATLLDSDYTGHIGIIGHTEGEDVRDVLQRNLEGLQQVLSDLGEPGVL